MEAVGVYGNHLFRTTLSAPSLDDRLAARTEFRCKEILADRPPASRPRVTDSGLVPLRI
jgi:hypothetical protein